MQTYRTSTLTSEYQRSALRQAMRAHPQDLSLQQAISNLSTPQQIQGAAHAGVFLNYARSDELFAVELALDLSDAGIPAWLDAFEVSYRPGDWHKEITQGLKNCGLMIAILSPSALNDEDVQTEQRRFWEMGKLIQPVVYRRTDMTQSPFWLPPVDCSHDYQVGLHQLLRLLELKPTSAPASVHV